MGSEAPTTTVIPVHWRPKKAPAQRARDLAWYQTSTEIGIRTGI